MFVLSLDSLFLKDTGAVRGGFVLMTDVTPVTMIVALMTTSKKKRMVMRCHIKKERDGDDESVYVLLQKVKRIEAFP